MLRTIAAASFSRFLSCLVTSLLCGLIAACGGQNTSDGVAQAAPGAGPTSTAATRAVVGSATDAGAATVEVEAQAMKGHHR